MGLATCDNLASADRTKHILYGDATGGGHLWPGKPGKSPFPAHWDADRVMAEISDVATDPKSVFGPGRGGRTLAKGTRDGVDITVVLESPGRGGGIVTGFPTNVPRNP
ncbi:MAG: EndoU domain-containing protein [Myxococcales bacterium]|nr:EndoU domain-containing protein [Myxococcales bacterium]